MNNTKYKCNNLTPKSPKIEKISSFDYPLHSMRLSKLIKNIYGVYMIQLNLNEIYRSKVVLVLWLGFFIVGPLTPQNVTFLIGIIKPINFFIFYLNSIKSLNIELLDLLKLILLSY